MDASAGLVDRKFLRTFFSLAATKDGEQIRLPSIKEFALSELVNGVGSYVGNLESPVFYGFSQKDFNSLIQPTADRILEAQARLDPDIADFFYRMTRTSIDHISHDGPSYENLFYEYWSNPNAGHLFKTGNHSTFSLPLDSLQKASDFFASDLIDSTQESQIREIAEEMHSYIEKDLPHIARYYNW